MSFLEQIFLWAVRHGNTLQFGLIWITVTVAAVTCVGLAVGRAAFPIGQNATRHSRDLALTRQQVLAPSVVAMLTLLVVFVVSYVVLILAWEDFAYYDNSVFTLNTLKGHNIQLWILPESGRFMPLAFQEFNLARHFTDTSAGYHVLPIVQLLIVSGILLFLDQEISLTARSALVIFALLTPSILVSFISFLFSERNVLLFLAGLAFSIRRFEQSQSLASALSAVICAQLMIYFKETAFLLLLGFAASRLVLRCQYPHVEFGRLWIRESRLDLGLAFLAVLFVIFYFGVMGIHGNMNYAASARLPRADVMLSYTTVDLLPWLLLAGLLGRIYMILRHRVAPLLLWDGLAAGGAVYFIAYVYLGMFSIYYTAPVDLIAVLYVGRFAVLSWKKMLWWGKVVAIPLAVVIMAQDILVSSFSVFERKNVIHANAELASVVENEYRRGTGTDLRLFFPFGGGEEIMEFGAYLSYRGVPVEGAADPAAGLHSVVLNRRRIREDGPCVEWRRIMCRRVSGPAPGDLVIVLPDDEASLAEASVYRERRGTLLLSYKPRPHLPQWLYSLFDDLPIGAESRYRDDALPDRWLDASVTKWK